MKLSINKKKIKSLSQDNSQLPIQATPAIAGGNNSQPCTTAGDRPTGPCTNDYYSEAYQGCNTMVHTDRRQSACCNTAAC